MGERAEPVHFSMTSLSVPKVSPIMPSLTLGVSRVTLGGLGLATPASEPRVLPTLSEYAS